jgi:hypothetical protein
LSPATPTAFPKVPAKAWRVLRDRAAAAPSTKFTPIVVASLLGMATPKSAGDNILYPLRRMGLFEDDGSLTERGNKWRLDTSYGEACQEILDTAYPDGLAALTDDGGKPNREAIESWFQHQGFGGSNAQQMARTYTMIASKELPSAPKQGSKPAAPKKPAKPSASAPASSSSGSSSESEKKKAPAEDKSRPGAPNVHLDIQIHIPSDASAEQIEQIFASMARHLYQQ